MEINERYSSESEYGKILLSFYRTVKEKYPFFDEKEMLKRLSNLEITTNPTMLKEFLIKNKDNSCGYYPESNKIIVFDEKNVMDYHIFHILFHMLSTYVDEDKIYCGFSQINKKTLATRFYGINEGYTQYLKERVFKPDTISDNNDTYSYMLQKHIAKHLEIIVGRSTMEKLYAEGNIYELIFQLEQYSTREDILNFLDNMDYINKDVQTSDLQDFVGLKLRDSLMFLIDTYINKQIVLLNQKLIDDNMFKNNIDIYLAKVSSSLHYNNKDYLVLSYDDIKDILISKNLKIDNSKHF